MSFVEDIISATRAKVSRRAFVKYSVLSGFTCLLPGSAWAILYRPTIPTRSLSLFNPDTKESLSTTYWSDGQYDMKALADINHFMRDWHTGEIKSINTDLVELLYAIGTELNVQRPLHVISGYRSLSTNILLRKRGRPAAEASYHLQGKAADIYIPKLQLSALRRISVQLKRGGVGYYPQSGFLHVDVGPIRYWSVR
jgi:uncharacterized protein YcbK (DUF882 family)